MTEKQNNSRRIVEATSKKLVKYINEKLKERGISLDKNTICTYLNDGLGKPKVSGLFLL